MTMQSWRSLGESCRESIVAGQFRFYVMSTITRMRVKLNFSFFICCISHEMYGPG